MTDLSVARDIGLSVAAVLVPVLIFLLERVRRGVSYEVTALIPLVGHHEFAAGKIDIYFKGQAVDDVHLVQVLLGNSGNSPIRPQDVERPILVEFGPGSQLLAAEIFETTPRGLNSELEERQSSVAIPPQLLNPGDKLHIRALVAGATRLDVSARIAGVRRISGDTRLAPILLSLSGAVLAIVGITFITSPSRVPVENIPAVVLIVGGYSLSVGGLLSSRWWRHRIRSAFGGLMASRSAGHQGHAGAPEARPGRGRSEGREPATQKGASTAGEAGATTAMGANRAEPPIEENPWRAVTLESLDRALKACAEFAESELRAPVRLAFNWVDVTPNVEFNFRGRSMSGATFGITKYSDWISIWGKRRDSSGYIETPDEVPWRGDPGWEPLLAAGERYLRSRDTRVDLRWDPEIAGGGTHWYLVEEGTDAEGYSYSRTLTLGVAGDLLDLSTNDPAA